jgi:hypothetical protein
MKNLPTNSLVKKTVGGQKPAWNKKLLKEYGSTSPEKLEARRDEVTMMVTTLERELANMRIFYEANKAEMNPGESFTINYYATHLLGQITSIKATALLIDCVSCRESVRVRLKSGEVVKGVLRVSVASKVHDIEVDTTDIADRLESLEQIIRQFAEIPDTESEEAEVEKELELEEEAASEVHVKTEEKIVRDENKR